jgi:adenylate cyclase
LEMRCETVLANSQPGSVETEEGYSLCERALERDERNVRALVNLSFKFTDRVLSEQSLDREDDIRQAGELVSRALAIDPNDYGAHYAKAEILLGQEHFEEAIVEAERSLALNPSFVSAYSALCIAGSFLGRPQQAVEST